MDELSLEQQQRLASELQRAYQAGFAHGTTVSVRGFFAASALESLLKRFPEQGYAYVAEESFAVADAMMVAGGLLEVPHTN